MTLSKFTSSDIAGRLVAGHAGGAAVRERVGSCPESRPPPRPASVLLPLFQQARAWHLLYILRALHERDRHSGEVAFPGGHAESRDADSTATALREAREELGLDPCQVDVLGRLRPFETVSGFLVTPVVGHIRWPLDLVPDPTEVARVFSIPLDWLRDPANHRVRVWPSADHPQARNVVFFDEFDGQQLWGISARITLDFLRCLE